MADYLVAVFTDLVRHSESWNRIPRDPMAGIMGEYKNIAEKTASEFGQLGHSFTGDGHFFLFRNADAAVRFGLTLLLEWRQAFQDLAALKEWDPIPLRIGAHFGVEAKLDDDSWVGRCGNTAKSIEGKADPDALLVSEGMLDLIDLPLYEYSRFGSRKLKSDHVDSRVLYRIDAFNRKGFLKKPEEELTASDWFLRATALIGTDRENTDEEERSYLKALELRPEFPEAHNNYGVLLDDQDRPNKSEEHYKDALRLRPDYPEVHNNYAILLYDHGGRHKEAEEHYKDALRLRPDYPEAHNNYAILLRLQDRAEEAEQHYKEALRLRPDYPEAHNNYAILLRRQDRPEEAEEHYKEALRLRPDYLDAHNNYGVLLEHQNRLEEAEEHCKEALRLGPDYPEAHDSYGVLLVNMDRTEEAEAHFKEALRLRPDYAEAHGNYADLLRRQVRPKEAEEHYRKALKLSPDDPDFGRAVEEERWNKAPPNGDEEKS